MSLVSGGYGGEGASRQGRRGEERYILRFYLTHMRTMMMAPITMTMMMTQTTTLTAITIIIVSVDYLTVHTMFYAYVIFCTKQRKHPMRCFTV